MSKLVKVDTAIAPAGKLADKLEAAFEGKLAATVVEPCSNCGHARSEHTGRGLSGAASCMSQRLGKLCFCVRYRTNEVHIDTAIANLAKPDRFDYVDMESIIVDEWANRFGYPETLEAVDEVDTKAIQPAMARARSINVKPSADIEVSECGCIWALQTTHDYGSGDVILRNCDEHKGKVVFPGER